MDLSEQNRFAEKLENLVKQELKERHFHVIVSVESDPGKCFTFSITSLNRRSPFQSCDAIVSGIAEETNSLVDKFDIPSTKVNKPIEPKWVL